MTTKTWHVDIDLDETGAETTARAVLVTEDGPILEGKGFARRNPHDPSVPEIGDEVAAGRALADLTDRLRSRSDSDIAAAAETGYHGAG